MSEAFLFKMRVRYAECDAQQVVFNSRYSEYADLAVTEYFRVLFGGIKQMLNQGLDTQVVRFTIDWLTPARFDDVLGIRVVTSRIGNTSFTLRLTYCDVLTQKDIAVAEVTYVLVTAVHHQKITINEDFRERLTRGAVDVVTDQSGCSSANCLPPHGTELKF